MGSELRYVVKQNTRIADLAGIADQFAQRFMQ